MPELPPEKWLQMRQLAELLRQPGIDTRKRRDLLNVFEQLRFECAKLDPYFFLTSMVKTLNEHPRVGRGSYEPFPIDKPYIFHMARTWEEVAARERDKILLIWKSRQMLASWFVVSMAIWTCMRRVGSLVLIRSRKEVDAAALIARACGVLMRLPEPVRELMPFEPGNTVIRIPSIDARIEGIPQGPEQVHGRTATLLIDDELALQDEAEAGFAEAQPALEGGGMYVGLSSARPGFMHRMVMDAA